jgi:hypothetical protein
MLEIRLIMNSPMEEILAFKTCCGLKVFDQNLEIHVKNCGDIPVAVPSYFDLVGEHWTRRVQTLIPHGVHSLRAGEMMAFYCQMDEGLWNMAKEVVFHDVTGIRYPVIITHVNQ